MKVKIGELTKIKTGKLDANASSEEGKYPFFTCSKEALRISTYSYDCECVLVAGNGDLNVKYYNGKFDAYQRTYIIEDDSSGKLHMPYLYYFMESYVNELRQQAIGGVIKYIKLGNLTDALVELPPINQQKAIVERLEKTRGILDKRNEEMNALDDLIKARFVEMFGDPQINPFGWAVVNISEVVGGKVSNGFFAKRDDYVDDGNVSILGVANIVNRMYSKVDELPKTDADDKDIEKFEVRYGDILFCRSSLVAEGIGKASIIPENVQDKVLFECHVIRLPLDLNKCVPEFIQTLSTTDFFRNQVIAQSKTATMTTIGQDGILKTDIILPPVHKQREFYDFVIQVDKSKFEEITTKYNQKISKLRTDIDSFSQYDRCVLESLLQHYGVKATYFGLHYVLHFIKQGGNQ